MSIQNEPADLAAELHRQRLVEQREERLWSRRRHVAGGQEIDHQPQALLGDAAHLRAVLVLRIALVDVDQAGDVLHHGGRQAPRHRVPVPLHEHEGDHRLQDHHRHDHDQQRARIEAGRHPALERVAHPAIGGRDAPGGAADQRQAGIERAHRCASLLLWRGYQPIADAAHRLQEQRIGGIALDLAPQAVDLHVDGALVDGAVAGQRAARHGLARRLPRGCAASRARGR